MSGITESMTNWLAENGIPSWLIPFLVSILPIIELRGGIIAARVLDMELIQAIWVCMLGNILPIPFILLFIDKIFDFLKKHKVPLLTKMVVYLEDKAMNKSSTMEKGEFWFLLFFVGIPLPGTGAWTEWTEFGIVLPLNAGKNTIQFVSATAEGGPNLDYIKLTLTDEPYAEIYDPADEQKPAVSSRSAATLPLT